MELGYLGSGHVHFSISAYFFMIFSMHTKTRKHGKIHILVRFAPLDLMSQTKHVALAFWPKYSLVYTGLGYLRPLHPHFYDFPRKNGDLHVINCLPCILWVVLTASRKSEILGPSISLKFGC